MEDQRITKGHIHGTAAFAQELAGVVRELSPGRSLHQLAATQDRAPLAACHWAPREVRMLRSFRYDWAWWPDRGQNMACAGQQHG